MIVNLSYVEEMWKRFKNDSGAFLFVMKKNI